MRKTSNLDGLDLEVSQGVVDKMPKVIEKSGLVDSLNL